MSASESGSASASPSPGSVAPGAYISGNARLEEGVRAAPGAVVYGDATVGAGTWIGSGAVIHSGTVVGQRCLIEDGAVLGKHPRLRPGSSAAGGRLAALMLGDGVTVCCGKPLTRCSS